MKSNRTEEIALATATHGNNIQKNTATALACAEKKEHVHFLKGSKSNKHAHTHTHLHTYNHSSAKEQTEYFPVNKKYDGGKKCWYSGSILATVLHKKRFSNSIQAHL